VFGLDPFERVGRLPSSDPRGVTRITHPKSPRILKLGCSLLSC
jgi:hypothetical protein